VFILLIAAALLSGCAGNPETVPPSFLGPTTGQFVNGTRWRVEVFVDADPQAFQSTPGIVLNPQETRQHSLDFAPHRVIAWAYVDTQFGTRTVGWYDRTLLVDPYATKWTLQFSEADFHSAAGLKETAAEEAKKKLDAGPRTLRRQDYGTPHSSLRELKVAAMQGHIVAQFNLGWMYAKGEGGVQRDYAQAIKWYRMAAEQGDAWAQNNLGEMYARGEGVSLNPVQAYMWLSLAIKGGFKPAIAYRERLAKKMTAAQIAEAESLAIKRQEGESGPQSSRP
jgi:tetratricopeptide (TPR) repeat protein